MVRKQLVFLVLVLVISALFPARAVLAEPGKPPAGVNPLTGLPVEDPALLELPPAMVSVSNFPVDARPQAGLSYSPYVFEVYIGMGMTRFLAMFYGEFPEAASASNGAASGAAPSAAGSGAAIGPIRSGRVSYEGLRKLYSGSLVMAGASSEVGARLNSTTRVFGKGDVNSTMVDATRLQQMAERNRGLAGNFNLTGNEFSTTAPQGGKAADKAWVFYNFYNQIEWVYDSASGAYLRYQDQADGAGEFVAATDRLTGEQLAFENVVVLFAEHTAQSATIIDINLMYRTRPALLFRDGQVYRIFWSTANGDYEKSTGRLRPIRFVDAQGNPFPMKPGQTWVQVVTETTTVQEQSQGQWKVRFYAP